MDWTLWQDVVYLRETSSVRAVPTRRPSSMTLTSRAAFEGDRSCLNAQDMELVHSTFERPTEVILFGASRPVNESMGKVCAQYYKVKQGFAVHLLNKNGVRLAQESVSFEFFTGLRAIRPQERRGAP